VELDANMKCPHCLESIHAAWHGGALAWNNGQDMSDREGEWQYRFTTCPACGNATIMLLIGTTNPVSGRFDVNKRYQVWPKGTARAALSGEVPEDFAADYREACLVFTDSPKASAALSRRCLQHLLRGKAGMKPADLNKEIHELLASKALPSDLAGAVDAIRAIGNFAAHPMKSTNTGEIVAVEAGEAELLLDVLESLFDFYFVRPAQLAAKLDAVNKKLADAGKPPLKTP
jgi:uncharacterized protein DUF4145